MKETLWDFPEFRIVFHFYLNKILSFYISLYAQQKNGIFMHSNWYEEKFNVFVVTSSILELKKQTEHAQVNITIMKW